MIGSYCNLKNGDIYFFKNGECLGKAFTIDPKYLDKGCHKVYPTVCLRESNLRVNFGKNGWLCPPRFALRPNNTLSHQIKNKEVQAVNYMDMLPKEMLVEVFSHVLRRDLVGLSRVCKVPISFIQSIFVSLAPDI